MPDNMAAIGLREALLPKAVVTAPPVGVKHKMPLSEARLQRQRAASAWNALSQNLQQEWAIFAQQFRRYSPAKTRVIAPSPRALFVRAVLDRWKLDSSLPAPTHPPRRAFSGDEIGVFAVQGSKKNDVPEGRLRFESTGRNRTGVLTAVLAQKLSGPSKKLNERYLKPVGFIGFTSGQPIFDMPVEPGYYATAYRFLDSETMQMSPIMEAGIVAVGIKPRKKKSVPKSQPTNIAKPSIAAPTAAINAERFASLHHWPE